MLLFALALPLAPAIIASVFMILFVVARVLMFAGTCMAVSCLVSIALRLASDCDKSGWWCSDDADRKDANAKCDQKTACEKQEKKTAAPEMDWSTVRSIDTEDESVRLVIAAPGVKTSDLKVSVEEGTTLVVKGKSETAEACYSVHRRIVPPRNVDVDSAVVTSRDGIVEIVMTRKPIKRIPVARAEPVEDAAPCTSSSSTAAKDERTSTAAAAEPSKPAAESPTSAPEDGWVVDDKEIVN